MNIFTFLLHTIFYHFAKICDILGRDVIDQSSLHTMIHILAKFSKIFTFRKFPSSFWSLTRKLSGNSIWHNPTRFPPLHVHNIMTLLRHHHHNWQNGQNDLLWDAVSVNWTKWLWNGLTTHESYRMSMNQWTVCAWIGQMNMNRTEWGWLGLNEHG